MERKKQERTTKGIPTKKKAGKAAPVEAPRSKITLERVFPGTLEDAWELWTTREGLETWWGPEGFVTTVRKLELRPGGRFEYEMTATGPEQVEAMKKANLPLTSKASGTYIEVTAGRRLAYRTFADFIPGVTPYWVGAVIDFHPARGGVRVTVTEDAMHSEEWTRMSEMGMSSSLDRLEKVLAGKRRKE